jgi:hypothetical protein
MKGSEEGRSGAKSCIKLCSWLRSISRTVWFPHQTLGLFYFHAGTGSPS